LNAHVSGVILLNNCLPTNKTSAFIELTSSKVLVVMIQTSTLAFLSDERLIHVVDKRKPMESFNAFEIV